VATHSLFNFVEPERIKQYATPSAKGGSFIRRGLDRKPVVVTLPPKQLISFVNCGYEFEVEENERDTYVLLKVTKVYKKEVFDYEIEGSTFVLREKTIFYYPEEKEEVEEKKHCLIPHPEVNEGGFGFFSALLYQIRELEKEVEEIRDELDRKRGDYLLSDLPTLASIASFLPSLPAIICTCGAIHTPSPKLGWWHTSCPACGNRWRVERQRVSVGGGGGSPIITPPLKVAAFADEDEDVGIEYIITTISAEKPIIYVYSLPDESLVKAKENVVLIDVGKVQYYNNLLKERVEKEEKLNKSRGEFESKWQKYEAAVKDLINYGGILICEGKCAVVYRNGEVECFSPDPNINTIELACDIKTAVKFFGGES